MMMHKRSAFFEETFNKILQKLNDPPPFSHGAAFKEYVAGAIATLWDSMHVVTHEQFDEQQIVLQHTRQRLEQLEKKVAQLEQQLVLHSFTLPIEQDKREGV